MKTCPTCNRVFDDATLFCLDDGASLTTAQTFQVPPPPTLRPPNEPSMSTPQTLACIFFAPTRAFASFRDVTTFTSTAVRFLIAAAIIVLATVAYNVIYPARIGSENIAQASIEVSPRLAGIPSEQKERALQMRRNPAFQIFGQIMRFGLLLITLLASLPLGALVYWLGAMLFKGAIAYMQALLVWTYATLPPTVLWMVANTLALFIWPPSTNMAIVRGSNGVIHANLGALFSVTTLPIPDHVVALSAFDLFAFYGLTLAVIGLQKVARMTWLRSLGIVIPIWLIGVLCRVAITASIGALVK
jgi:hypothetical protein